MNDVTIRPLRPEDAPTFVRIRREYLLDSPLVFSSSPEDDLASLDAVRRIIENTPDSMIFGAFAPDLIGVVALYRDPQLKARHRAHLWGMYVRPRFRGRGIGRALLEAALEHAASRLRVDWVHLTVTSAAPGARRLYERVGFEAWGTDPDALRVGERSVTETYMALRLERSRDG